VVKTQGKQACPVCGTLFPNDSESCPVCALRGALEPESDASSIEDATSELRFEHYQVLKNADGTPLELGHGAMGVTYKAFDVHLRCLVALKIINTRFIGDDSARRRFVREARAAASVRHPNVASVLHLGETGGNYFYAMEFVDGETLEKLIQRSGSLETDLALEIVGQVAAGLTAIQKQHLVHRDIKPSNIMVSQEGGRLESVKIIDLGLAKGVAEEDTISTAGSFTGTPSYASPEQFAGIGSDIRSDLYSLGVTLWEMLSGKLPFQGSATELIYLHQHAAVPIDKLKGVPAPIIALLEILLAKDPNQRFQSPAQFQQALTKVRGAIRSGLRLTADKLRLAGDQMIKSLSKGESRKKTVRWVLAGGLCFAGVLIAWFFLASHSGFLFNQRVPEAVSVEKSIAVLPFESLSENKSDAYFADGVQDEILNNLAKIAQLKVISRTSVMQYRADNKRDLRQIANALSVANILEGTVRRDGNHVRVSTELVDARNDHTIWADSYDRDLADIFSIQSEVAQTIAGKLAAALSPEEKERIEAKPTENLEAYDLYLRAKELTANALTVGNFEAIEERVSKAVDFLKQAVRLDPNFALAYCASAEAQDGLYWAPEADAAIGSALSLQPDLPEVRLAYARHLAFGYGDYERARVQLAIAKRTLSNNPEAILFEGFLDQMQGNLENAIQRWNKVLTLDPGNSVAIKSLAITFSLAREYRASEQAFDRLIRLLPDQPTLRIDKAFFVTFRKTGDDTALHSAIATLPPSLRDNRGALSLRMHLAGLDRDWQQLQALIEKMNGGEENGDFDYTDTRVPVGCYSILLARLQGGRPEQEPSSAETRERLSQKIQKWPRNASGLSSLAVVDALLGKKNDAITKAERASEMVPISRDAWNGIGVAKNLAIVYAWTGELDLSFETLKKVPFGLHYGELKVSPFWDPLRKDPRFDKLLAELAPKD
jgi:serine/threonine protein kinase/Tfp pilus assembly protein PilF